MKIEIENISFGHNLDERILEKLNYSISDGVLGILGQSGCGKSTLLRIIGGLLRPDEGDIKVDGESIWKKHHCKKKGYIKKNRYGFSSRSSF